MAIAEDVTKVHAVCVDCGYTANCSYRLTDNESLVLLGEKDMYIPYAGNATKPEKKPKRNFAD